MVKKMPNCAAAPKSSILGFESSGPKSIIAPMPMNSSSGSASLASMVVSKSHWMMPWLADALDHLVEDAGARQVDEDGAEAHRQQQRGLIVLLMAR